jgi:uncharacterized membrane protein
MLCILVATAIVAYPLVASDSRKLDAAFLATIGLLAMVWAVFVARRVIGYVERRDDLSRCQLMTAMVRNKKMHGGGVAFLVTCVLLCTCMVLSIAYVIMRNVTRWGLLQKLTCLTHWVRQSRRD